MRFLMKSKYITLSLAAILIAALASFSIGFLFFFFYVFILGIIVFIGVILTDLVGKTDNWKGAIILLLFGAISLIIGLYFNSWTL